VTPTQRAVGTFTVQMTPQGAASQAPAGATPLARLSLDKVFSGAMAGTSHGDMLTAVTPTEGSAGYVAIERFTGTVHGHEGSFVLQHSGTMSRQHGQQLSITIVPDSGSDALQGIEGRFLLKVENGQHHYELEYMLARASHEETSPPT
jgi:predicted flavoprotein YhiN